MALKSRVWGAGKIIVLIGALGLTYFAFAFASMRIAVRTREVQVPDLTGQTVEQATASLTSLGLSLRVDDARRLDPDVPADHIQEQQPAAGVTTRRQRSVRVWLSAGERNTTIPPLAGETERTARLRLQSDGIDLLRVAEIRSSDFPAGMVVAQYPSTESRGTGVSLLVNRGERRTSFVMPDLIGLDADRVAELLRNREFRVSFVAEQPYPGVPAGIVLRQSPQAGFQIVPGEAVSLEVSQ